MSLYVKDPAATLDYSIDWAAGYLSGQTIISSAWSVTPEEPGGVLIEDQIYEPGRTSVTVSGGVRGHIYRVANHVVLSDGRSDERGITLRVMVR